MIKQFHQMRRIEIVMNILSVLIILVILAGAAMLVVVNVTDNHNLFDPIQGNQLSLSTMPDKTILASR